MKYGPNSEQVAAYLEQVARLDADGWAAVARELQSSSGHLGHAARVIDTARSRATRNGLLSEVDAAARETHKALDATLDASSSLRELLRRALAHDSHDEPSDTVPPGDAQAEVLKTAARSGAMLLVLRPLLSDDEFSGAWPMPAIDPRNLPYHLHVPPIGAAG
ncbi:MAG: hypothetical protein AB1Z66_11900 [Candidatus Limnocylindrales bacterium]